MLPFPKMPANISAFITSQLWRALPPPPDDRPETCETRNVIAMASVARLGPDNTMEAALAVQAVGAQAHATDCLAAINEHRDDFRKAAQCRAQSALMMRQAAQALKELRILQEDRAIALAYRRAETEATARHAEAENRFAGEARTEASAAGDQWRTQEPHVEGTTAEQQAHTDADAPPDEVDAAIRRDDAVPVTTEDDPEPLISERPRSIRPLEVEGSRLESHELKQNPTQRIHETLPGLRLDTPLATRRARPSKSALIAALLAGMARQAGPSGDSRRERALFAG